MKMRFLSLSIILLSALVPLKGQVVYGLKECISIGLEKNFSILVARNSETISNNNYSIGNAGYLPTLDLSSRYSGTLNNTTQNFTDGSQNITNGANNTTTNAGVTLGWTIFNGFNVQTTYKKLDQLKQLGALNTQLAVENLLAGIISGYYNYIEQVQMLNNMKYAVTLSKERLRIDEDRYLLGSNSKLQVLQSRVYLNADSSNLSKQFEVVRAAQIRLNELMAAEDLGNQFISKDTSIVVNSQLLYEKLFEETLTGNTSLIIASKNKTVSEYDYKIIVSRSYPYLNMSTGYSYNLNTYSTGTYNNQITNGMNYGLTLGVNIFDGFNQRRSINNSSIELKNKELNYLEIKQGIKADLITIYSAYSNNLRLINLEEQNLETATENLDIALERYKLGSLSGIDLREVQKSLLDAKERLLSIQYQTKLAEISLQLISGKIMEYYK
ncbi:MAG: TolC family protein [Bacteroidetes bacterium]|jgi:outer membrane protein, adhesin transport system|nr:TolC family protein [Bacteroidota bacterium]